MGLKDNPKRKTSKGKLEKITENITIKVIGSKLQKEFHKVNINSVDLLQKSKQKANSEKKFHLTIY